VIADAPAKINLALVVGPMREDGKHEVVTLMAPLDLTDRIELDLAGEVRVEGFDDDTLVHSALEALWRAAETERRWRVRIEKRIPVASGLGGGSSDAAAALRLGNETLPEPLSAERLRELAAGLGADVPFFLSPGAKVARGDGTLLSPIDLERQYAVLLLLPDGAVKRSTADVYRAFDARGGERGFERRVAELEAALRSRDLTKLPRNDLASSPHSTTLVELGAVRADVTGAGPVVYALFTTEGQAAQAGRAIEPLGRVWLSKSGW
jgi:4-diphosphocytidyl-2-C-methyl-D-erythritol kinase